MTDFLEARRKLVEHQIIERGITEPLVVNAMLKVPREEFVPEKLREHAYADRPLPIGEGQTISQPYVVALMIEALGISNMKGKVLEIGAGSGYAAAVLGQIASDVFTIERNEFLAERAKAAVKKLGYGNVHVLQGDGTLGLKEEAPFDAIIVAAGGPDLPRNLLEQLKMGGRLVIPVGTSQRLQQLLRVTRKSEQEYDQEDLGGVMFVPLIGAQGWKQDNDEFAFDEAEKKSAENGH